MAQSHKPEGEAWEVQQWTPAVPMQLLDVAAADPRCEVLGIHRANRRCEPGHGSATCENSVAALPVVMEGVVAHP